MSDFQCPSAAASRWTPSRARVGLHRHRQGALDLRQLPAHQHPSQRGGGGRGGDVRRAAERLLAGARPPVPAPGHLGAAQGAGAVLRHAGGFGEDLEAGAAELPASPDTRTGDPGEAEGRRALRRHQHAELLHRGRARWAARNRSSLPAGAGFGRRHQTPSRHGESAELLSPRRQQGGHDLPPLLPRAASRHPDVGPQGTAVLPAGVRAGSGVVLADLLPPVRWAACRPRWRAPESAPAVRGATHPATAPEAG